MKFGEAARIASTDDWVTNQYHQYAKNRKPSEELKAMEAILTRPERIREGNWSASSASTCKRKQQFSFLGFEQIKPVSKTNNIFANGDWTHYRHQAFGLVAGYISRVEVPVRKEEYRLRGTMDGVLSNDQGLEIKSINSYGFRGVATHGPKEMHVWQMQSYMLASDIDAFRAVYENKDDNTVREFLVKRDDKIIEEIKEDLETLNEYTENKKLLPMQAECVRKEGEYRWCPYRSVCPKATFPVKPVIRRTSNTDNG